MRQTPVAKGDFHISRRSTHPDLNLTKSDVKVTIKICSGSPARSVRNSHPMPFFTPDSGPTVVILRILVYMNSCVGGGGLSWLVMPQKNGGQNCPIWATRFRSAVTIVEEAVECMWANCAT